METRRRAGLNLPLLTMILILLAFGLAVVYGITAYRGSEAYGDGTYFLKKQLFFVVIGFGIMVFMALTDYKQWMKVSKPFLQITTVIMLINMIGGLITAGSTRYFMIGTVAIVPSEFAKLAVLIYTADITMRMSKSVNSLKGLVRILSPVLICIFVMSFENLSNAIICFLIMLAILFVVCPKTGNVIGLTLACGITFVIFTVAVGFRFDKISTWLSSVTASSDFTVVRALASINNADTFGNGLSSSTQGLSFITEAKNDITFSVMCEEWGTLGAFLLVSAVGILIYHLHEMAKRTNERFAGLLLTGVIAHLSLQLALNIAVAVAAIPSFGTYLPFVSYGASYIIVTLMEMGLALSIIREGN